MAWNWSGLLLLAWIIREPAFLKQTNQVIHRILIFYVGSLAVLLSLMPWTRVGPDTSPFVLIFRRPGDALVANALNVVILTAALSVYNSWVATATAACCLSYQQGNAPKALLNVDKRVPVALSSFLLPPQRCVF